MNTTLLSSPLQGFTDFRFRNAFQKYFGGIDTFYAPYIRLDGKLGIKPSCWFDLYIYDIELGILVHPYDDRGMDVVGTNKFMMKRIYKQYHNWLLDYDINVMREWFGAL